MSRRREGGGEGAGEEGGGRTGASGVAGHGTRGPAHEGAPGHRAGEGLAVLRPQGAARDDGPVRLRRQRALGRPTMALSAPGGSFVVRNASARCAGAKGNLGRGGQRRVREGEGKAGCTRRYLGATGRHASAAVTRSTGNRLTARTVPAGSADRNGTGGGVVSRDGGALQLDQQAGDRQSCHPEQGAGRRHPGRAQPARQRAVVLEEQIDIGRVDVEADEVRE